MKLFMRYGLLGVFCYIAWWLVMLFLALYFLAKIWPVVLAVVLLVVLIATIRHRKRRKRS